MVEAISQKISNREIKISINKSSQKYLLMMVSYMKKKMRVKKDSWKIIKSILKFNLKVINTQ